MSKEIIVYRIYIEPKGHSKLSYLPFTSMPLELIERDLTDFEEITITIRKQKELIE